jgi:type II secretory pathway pseudopilin PulG
MSMRIIHNQRGMALVMTLVALVLFAMLGLFLAVNSQTESQIVNNEQSAKRAFDIANAGLSHAFRLIGDNSTSTAYKNGFDDELSNDGTGGALATASSAEVTIEGKRYRQFSFAGGTYNVRAEDNYDDADQSTDNDQRIMIISRGQYTTATGTAEKIVRALALPATPCALTMEKDLTVSGNTSTDNVQINTVDGFGACAHTNGAMTIRGNPTFPDGATSTGVMDCEGSASIKQGDCSNAQGSQPRRDLPTINVGELALLVATLGEADPNGPYYILHTQDAYNAVGTKTFSQGDISKGTGSQDWSKDETTYTETDYACRKNDSTAASASSSKVGYCSKGTLVVGTERTNLTGGTSSASSVTYFAGIEPAEVQINSGGNGSLGNSDTPFSAGFQVYAANGNSNGNSSGNSNSNSNSNSGSGGSSGTISISSGKCTFSGNIPNGIYYCDGQVENSGTVTGANVTIIARNHVVFSSQIDLETFFPVAPAPPASPNPLHGSGTGYIVRLNNLPDSSTTEKNLKEAAISAMNTLSNMVLVAGADIRMAGNNAVSITGIVLAHNEVDLQGGKTFTGYIQACDGLPTYTGDPWPESRTSEFVPTNEVTGSVTINFQNFGTAFPLGAPSMSAWQDQAQ